MLRDLPLDELRRYQPAVEEPADFAEFWAAELASAATAADGAEPLFARVEDSGVRHADVFDVTFPGYAGDPIRGWLLLPHAMPPDTAFVVEYIGYGGGRGDPFDWLTWSCAGHPHLIMDSRGQGGGWLGADTPDPSDNGAPSSPGFLTRGIADPRTYYYTRLFVDAARAVDVARRHPASAGRPVVTTGGSQGGGLAIAAAHLGDRVAAALPDVPFLAAWRRAVEVTEAHPYVELINYCSVHSDQVDQVFRTLSYIDVVNHAKRATRRPCSPWAWSTRSPRRPPCSPRTTTTPAPSRSGSTSSTGTKAARPGISGPSWTSSASCPPPGLMMEPAHRARLMIVVNLGS